MQIDRWGRLARPPEFLSPMGPRDRRPWRAAVIGLVFVAGSIALHLAIVHAAGDWLAELSAADRADYLRRVQRGESAAASPRMDIAWNLASTAWYLGIAALVLTAAVTVLRRPTRTFLTAARQFRWRHLAIGAVVGGSAVLTAAAVRTGLYGDPHQFIFTGETMAPFGFAMLAAAVVVNVATGFSEEAIFRGWMMQQTAAFTRNLIVIVGLQAVVFALYHLEFQPEELLSRGLMGAAFAWTALRLGGLEFAMGAHASYDLALEAFPSVFTGDSVEAVERAWAADAAKLNPEGFVAALALVGAVEVMRLLRRRASGHSLLAAAD
ncbi:MAG TPA: type II CAAX endopeptidase family protein [Caulobacteraceae bacterium]|jgi:hypothetical protein